MRKLFTVFVSAVALGLAMFVPVKASAQGVNIYIGPDYPGYAYPAYPNYYGGTGYSYAYPRYGYGYPSYGYPSYGYDYGRRDYGAYRGHGRRTARRVYRRHDRW